MGCAAALRRLRAALRDTEGRDAVADARPSQPGADHPGPGGAHARRRRAACGRLLARPAGAAARGPHPHALRQRQALLHGGAREVLGAQGLPLRDTGRPWPLAIGWSLGTARQRGPGRLRHAGLGGRPAVVRWRHWHGRRVLLRHDAMGRRATEPSEPALHSPRRHLLRHVRGGPPRGRVHACDHGSLGLGDDSRSRPRPAPVRPVASAADLLRRGSRRGQRRLQGLRAALAAR